MVHRSFLVCIIVLTPAMAQVPRFPSANQRLDPSGQNPITPDESGRAKPAETPGGKATEGLWPSPKLMKLLLGRWADQAATRYDLDETQRGAFQERLIERWTEFLDDNRPLLQPLANEFIEMRMGLEPPKPEVVEEWSGRALPAFEKVKTQLRHSQDEFREGLTPMQRAKFELDALKTGAGLLMAESKLREWNRGEFDPEDVWQPIPSMRRDSDDDDKADAVGSASTAKSTPKKSKKRKEPPDQIATELTAWEKYVADFIALYELAEGQRIAALSCLREVSERAASHRDRHRAEIEDLEKRIAAPEGSAEGVESIKTKLVELYGPVDDMFAELKSRLEAIPTAEQRARAAEQPQQK